MDAKRFDAPPSAWGRAAGVVALAIATAAGCVGDIGGGDGRMGGGGSKKPAFVPAAPTIHRLSQVQLTNSWRALFGASLVPPPASALPSDDQLYGFTSISAATRTISPLDAEQYETATYGVLEQVWAEPAWRESVVGCAPTVSDGPCVANYFASFGRRAFRRPLEVDELARFVALSAEVATSTGELWEGLRFGTAAVLQSPHFLFRIESGESAPGDDAAHAGLLRFTSYEMASRLSFLLTDAPPSDTLLDAAASGELVDPMRVRSYAEALLHTPEARDTLVRFFRDFMSIGRLDQLDKSVDLFPQFTATLGPSMRTELEKLFLDTAFEKVGDFRQLFTTNRTFVNEELANIYGIAGVVGPDFVPVTLPDDGRRAGLLTTPGFLALNAHKTATSPTHRGRFVRISLLCEDVAPPPPGVDTTIPEPDPDKPTTLRERLEAHRESDQCRSCHMLMDPIGFGLEHFDALGQWRETDNGLPVDVASDLDGEPFEGGVELGQLVAELPSLGACVARRFYQHATAHLDKFGDQAAVDALVAAFVASDYDFKKLVIELVVNDGFRYASVPEVGP